MAVDGKTYTSNVSKLLRHMDKLQNIQAEEKKITPVMVHMAPTNVCNLHCDYCCYGQRPIKGELTVDQAAKAISAFAHLGTKGLEWTGGGDPTMWKHLDAATEYAYNQGMHLGLITNALDFRHFSQFDKLDWMRVSFHAANVGKNIEPGIQYAKLKGPKVDVSGVYIWTKGSEETLPEVARLADKYKIPTRVTPDLTLGTQSIDFMMEHVGNNLKAVGSEYLFLSDFNVKTTRRNDHCYMHMIKPFVYPDGNVYVCPSAALSPENNLRVNEQFKVCSIDGIVDAYTNGPTMRNHGCNFCKYSQGNELIDDIVTKVGHRDFA